MQRPLRAAALRRAVNDSLGVAHRLRLAHRRTRIQVQPLNRARQDAAWTFAVSPEVKAAARVVLKAVGVDVRRHNRPTRVNSLISRYART